MAALSCAPTPKRRRHTDESSPSADEQLFKTTSDDYFYKPIKMTADNVHKTMIKLEPLLVGVTDTSQYQRLRELKQLGTASHVYPTAQHTRFDHSLGVCHLAGEVCRYIRNQPQMPEDVEPPSERDVLCVKLAALVHDLGHGPFSHFFDAHVVPAARDREKCVSLTEGEANCPRCKLAGHTHEKMSIAMLRHLLAKNPRLYDLGLELKPDPQGNDSLDFRFVEELILGADLDGGVNVPLSSKRRGVSRSKYYLYEIVSNADSGLDVDKLDYLLRDPHYCHGGMPAFNLPTLFEGMSVRWAKMPGCRERRPVIAFAQKVVSEVWKVFRTRVDFHSETYTHQSVQGRDLLLTDLLLKCDEVATLAHDGFVYGGGGVRCGIGRAVCELQAYEKLDDRLIALCEQLIAKHESIASRSDDGDSPQERQERDRLKPTLAEARALMDRWEAHGHYKCLGERACTPEELRLSKAAFNDELAQQEAQLHEQTGSDALTLKVLTIHHGHPTDKSRNPLEDVCFYDKGVSVDDEVYPGTKSTGFAAEIRCPAFFVRKSVRYFCKAAGEDARRAKEAVELEIRKRMDGPTTLASPAGSSCDPAELATEETQPGSAWSQASPQR